MSAGKPFTLRCRDPRCSLACRRRWARKKYEIFRRYLTKHLPDSMRLYRGCFPMPNGASIADHRAARKKFLQALRCNRQRRGTQIEVQAVTHPTRSSEQHYDVILVAEKNAPVREVRRLILGLWQKAGGSPASLVAIKGADPSGAIGYAFKHWAKHQSKVMLCVRNGLTQTWGTRFFREKSAKEVWKELRAEWSSKPKPQAAVTPDPDREDIDILCDLLPQRPEDAIDLSRLAHRAGMTTKEVRQLLDKVPGPAMMFTPPRSGSSRYERGPSRPRCRVPRTRCGTPCTPCP